MTPRSNRTSLARKRWHESQVQWVASLASLIHGSAVPRWLWTWTTADEFSEGACPAPGQSGKGPHAGPTDLTPLPLEGS